MALDLKDLYSEVLPTPYFHPPHSPPAWPTGFQMHCCGLILAQSTQFYHLTNNKWELLSVCYMSNMINTAYKHSSFYPPFIGREIEARRR